ncbi:hypothetical protein FH972_001989 [Carpinus fangiana]|uniref:Uncharacterized protein n=1 Tax=Carpinus fangiana TaxID=176857 RepID=A0A5N6QDT5_9ROSI|nr:hypothetical protein FH972_001989 [Carpinus fangiana]
MSMSHASSRCQPTIHQTSTPMRCHPQSTTITGSHNRHVSDQIWPPQLATPFHLCPVLSPTATTNFRVVQPTIYGHPNPLFPLLLDNSTTAGSVTVYRKGSEILNQNQPISLSMPRTCRLCLLSGPACAYVLSSSHPWPSSIVA